MSSNLKELCKRAGIKQEALAKQVGVSQGIISSWSNDKYFPSAENLIQLSSILNVSTDCILGLKPIPEGYPDHLAPVEYNEAIRQEQIAAEPVRVFKPTKKPPFSRDQLDYLDEWGKSLKTDVAEEVVERLREVSSLLRETGGA